MTIVELGRKRGAAEIKGEEGDGRPRFPMERGIDPQRRRRAGVCAGLSKLIIKTKWKTIILEKKHRLCRRQLQGPGRGA